MVGVAAGWWLCGFLMGGRMLSDVLCELVVYVWLSDGRANVVQCPMQIGGIFCTSVLASVIL